MAKKRETRINADTRVVLMAEADGYVMVRRPGCVPFVIRADRFREMPLEGAAPKKDGA